MKIKTLDISNFLTIGKAEVSLDNRGLLLIQGDNRDDTSADSNGAGKSSVVDAISWSVFGVTARGVTGDSVVNLKAAKNTRVQVTLEDGADTFKITRTRKPNGLAVLQYTGGVVTDLTKGTEKETQAVIERIMGCTLEVFLAAVYAGQEAMPDLPGMTDKQLKVLIEEAAGVEVLNRAYDIARQRLQTAKGEAARMEVIIATAEGAVRSEERSVQATTEAIDEWVKVRDNSIAQHLAAAKAASEKVQTQTGVLNTYDLAALTKELDEGKAKLAGLSDEKRSLAELDSKARATAKALAAAMGTLTHLKAQYNTHTAALPKIDERVGTPCGECGKPYHTHDLEEARKRLTETVNQSKAKTLAAAQEAKRLKDEDDAARAALDAFAASMTDTSVLSDRLLAVQGQMSTVQAIKRQIEVDTDQIRQHIDAAKALKTRANPNEAKLELARKALDDAKAALADSQAKAAEKKQEVATLEDSVKVFGPSGVRAHILDTVTPFLNEKTSEYLGALSDGTITALWSTLTTTAKGDTREKFNIDVASSKGADSFAGLSGGEKRKVRLSCALALQDLVATRATKPIEIFIADEVDHALDESGLERLMGVLERKARERGTVLVISHNSLSDWIDNVMTVVKEGGISRVEGSV